MAQTNMDESFIYREGGGTASATEGSDEVSCHNSHGFFEWNKTFKMSSAAC